MQCTRKNCSGELYCFNTRLKKNNNIRKRNYLCIDCGARYKSTEVLESKHYKIKPIPEYYLKNRGMI